MENNQRNAVIPAQKDQQKKDTIDLLEVFYLFLGHIWQILLALVLGGAVAFVATYFLITPQYQASAKIYIVSASDESSVNLTDLQLGSQLTTAYKELLLSRPLLEDVSNSLDQNVSAGSLAGMFSITNTNDTRILKITATCVDPQLAADAVNELVAQACVYLPKIMETTPPNIVETAIVPTQKSSPSYSKNTIMGALILAVLYCGILLVRFLMNDTLITPDDVEQYLGVQPLGVIPEGELGGFNRAEHKKKRRIRKRK